MKHQGRPARQAVILVVSLAIVLGVLHQDWWWWDDNTLLFGFLPIGLGYHALFSLMAASLWALAIKIAWPHHLERMAEAGSEAAAPRDREAAS
jgi:hypothetical protein